MDLLSALNKSYKESTVKEKLRNRSVGGYNRRRFVKRPRKRGK